MTITMTGTTYSIFYCF